MKKTIVIMLVIASLAAAEPVDVLVYAAGVQGDFSTLIGYLTADARIDEVGFFNARTGMMYDEELILWDVVLVEERSGPWYLPDLTGDEMAEYVDNGGAVILAGLALGTDSIAGDIIMPPYSPMLQDDPCTWFPDTDWYWSGHPIFDDIDPMFENIQHARRVRPSSCCILLAYYDDHPPYYDTPELAVNQNSDVVGLNYYLADDFNTYLGDEWALVCNVVAWLGDYSPAVKEMSWGAIKALSR